MCHMFFDTLKISWYILKNSIESYHACINIARAGIFLKIHGQRATKFLHLWLLEDNS